MPTATSPSSRAAFMRRLRTFDYLLTQVKPTAQREYLTDARRTILSRVETRDDVAGAIASLDTCIDYMSDAVGPVTRTPTRDQIGTKVVRADEVRVRDVVESEDRDGTVETFVVTAVEWVGDDVTIFTFDRREVISTSEGNAVRVVGRV